MIKRAFIILVGAAVLNCSAPEKTITIAINPWPGYEFLYLAEQLGYFRETGTNIALVQFSSLAGAQSAYINGQVDGLASTLIEVVQANLSSKRPLVIALVADYSNGGDVIISHRKISSVAELRGRTVGAELSSLGIYVLQSALEQSGLSLNDVKLRNTGQLQGEQALVNGQIDAFVSYPPASISILKHPDFHLIFSSAEIPNQIIDVVSIDANIVNENPQLIVQLHDAWQMALDFYAANPDQAAAIMATREGISVEEFQAVLNDLDIIPKSGQHNFFAQPQRLEAQLKSVCLALLKAQVLTTTCDRLPTLASLSPTNP